MKLRDLVGKIQEYNPSANVGMVEAAYAYSAQVHKGQTRMSGEPYLTHPMAVASIIAEMKLDVPSVVTGLLHDTVEDTLATLEEIEARFGKEVRELVDGVTKISMLELESDSRETQQAESLRKLLVASAKDIRVLLVKLADRAHNLRTLDHLRPEKQMRIAQETQDLYVPLANRLGINWLKAEFEDRCFRTLRREEYEELSEKLSLKDLERQGYIEEVSRLLSLRLEEAGIEASVTGRTKSSFSIYRKMIDQNLKHDEVYDVVAFRIVVDAVRECYEALGVVHMNWRPVPGRFRDYLALPKANRYQSLHTTVVGAYGERLEVQVRTHEMHRVAEFGVAAHWRYKDPSGEPVAEDERFQWLRQILDWQQHLDDPAEFLSSVKEDLFAEEVWVFTPKGETRTFKKGETVVDFAYSIHTEVGNSCAGARANGKLVPLRYQLQQGDTIEVITTEDSHPSKEWLKFIRSPRAREQILQWVRKEDREKAVKLGLKLLETDLSRWRLDVTGLRSDGRLDDLVEQFGFADEAAFLEAVGYGRVSTRQVLGHLMPETNLDPSRSKRRLNRLFGLFDRNPKPLVTTETESDGMVRFGKCCEPLPGEVIVGFLTRGRGVTVHNRDCPRLGDIDPERLVEVNWGKGARLIRPVKIEVTSRDRPALLANMSQAIASAGVNIDRAHVRTDGKRAFNVFEMKLSDAEELNRVTKNLRRVPGVKSVMRVYS